MTTTSAAPAWLSILFCASDDGPSLAAAVEDLELLDDEARHAYCATCYPRHRLGVPFIARCGRRAIGFVGIADQPPANACPDCLAVLDQPCEGGDPR